MKHRIHFKLCATGQDCYIDSSRDVDEVRADVEHHLGLVTRVERLNLGLFSRIAAWWSSRPLLLTETQDDFDARQY